MYKDDLHTDLKSPSRKEQTCTFYCRGVKTKNKNFALTEAKRLRFSTIGKYIDALLEYRRTIGGKGVENDDTV